MTPATIAIAVVVVGVLALLVAWSWRRRQHPDGVATFQRQIDALSAEARQRVVDEVHRIDEEKKGPPDGT